MLIFSGSPQDQFYLGGSPWNLPDGSFCRFGTSFSYRIPVPEDGPYRLVLTFREPVPGAKRSFNVLANSSPILQNFSPLSSDSRSFLIYSANQLIVLEFSTILRSAILSSLSLEPFLIGAFPWLGQA